MINWDKPIETVDGRSAKLVHTGPDNGGRRYLVVLEVGSDHEYSIWLFGDGCRNPGIQQVRNVPEKVKPVVEQVHQSLGDTRVSHPIGC